jgi:hypothetical protein
MLKLFIVSSKSKEINQGKIEKKTQNLFLFFIQQALHNSSFPKLVAKTKLKEGWDVLQQLYEGKNKVKVVKLQSLRRKIETLCMHN